MQDFDELVKGELNRFKAILTIELHVKPDRVERLLTSFQGRLDEFTDKAGKQLYVMFLSQFFRRLYRTVEHLDDYLLSLEYLDIRERYLTYAPVITNDDERPLFIFHVLCSEAIAGMNLNGFCGVEFVYQYSIGEPSPVYTRDNKETPIINEIENGRVIDIGRHFHQVSAIKVFETAGSVKQPLWPLKVVLSAGNWVKTIVLHEENDFVDISNGRGIPCNKELAPLIMDIFPHKVDPNMKFFVNVLGVINIGDSEDRQLNEVSKRINYRELGFQQHFF